MRVWEVEDKKVAPADLVREQDFILRIRRLHRLGEPTLVINIPLTAIDPAHGGRGPLEEAQERLQVLARKSGGSYAEMANGDVFLLWPESETTNVLPDWVMNVVLPDGVGPDDATRFRFVYRLPDGYTPLRERMDHYIALSREPTAQESEGTAAQLLLTETARGPLTAWGADQIEKLLHDIDLHRYLRTQPIYERGADGVWRPLFLEIFMSLGDLRQAHFPKMEIEPSEHLFLELCQTIDQRLLVELSQHPEILDGPNISLNVSVSSLMGTAFAAFAYAIPRANHGAIFCELNIADLWQDFTHTLGAIESLRHEGFKIIIDGITPSMLPYLNLNLFNADFIKVNASKDHVAALTGAQTHAALANMPRDKIIFFRCDNEQALATGQELGIAHYQGWLIDDRVQKKES